MTKQRGQVVVDKILDTAGQLFYNQGYNSTGINQIIEEADIAKASLYKHFESKADLMIAYVQRTHERWFDRLKTAIDQVSDPKKKLLALFDHHLQLQEIRQFGGCPFIKANDEAGASDPRILDEIQKMKLHEKAFIKMLVVHSGHRKLLNDQELADTISYMLGGSIVMAAVFKRPKEIKSAKAIIQKLI